MQIIRRAIPRSRRLERATHELSRAARLRLSWMDHYQNHGQNAVEGGPPDPKIPAGEGRRWKGRYDPDDLRSLEVATNSAAVAGEADASDTKG